MPKPSRGMTQQAIDKFRFAVGADGRRWSSLWYASLRGSDFYVGIQRNPTKISLHAHGTCLFAIDKNDWRTLEVPQSLPAGENHFVAWKRTETPPGEAVHVVSIYFPSDFLRLREPAARATNKPLCLLEPAPSGQAVEVGIFYYRGEADRFMSAIAALGYTPAATTELVNGEQVFLTARHRPFDHECIANLFRPAQLRPFIKDPSKALLESKGLSMCASSHPVDGERLDVVEITGIAMRSRAGA